ncbi:hypothetical protein [Bacillus atrophaeus]|uniref:hypothetical protein n=1 Tax=Bacillus atrophaeus TaxID=1452 RepID=UPI002E1AF1E1|nr:hypothetical protein [Bacillus atrophaeus]
MSQEQKLFVVEIAEMVMGYWQVTINDLPIVNYQSRDEANKFVEHFMTINKDKNIKRI